MGFDNWQFAYTPPATVSTPAVISTTAAEPAPSSPVAATNAGKLSKQLQDLIDTALYLQQLILANCSSLVIPLNSATDPETDRALTALYGKNKPSGLTAAMYSRILDAQFSSMQAKISMGANSQYQLQPVEQAALAQISVTATNALVDAGDFTAGMATLLADLKGDVMFFQNLQQAVQNVPAYTTAQNATATTSALVTSSAPLVMSTLDVSPALTATLSSGLAGFNANYASVYTLNSTIGMATADVNRVLNTYINQPVAKILQMNAMFQGFLSILHIPRLKDLVNGLTALVFVELMAEVSVLVIMADQFVQMAVMPLKSMLGQLHMMIMAIQGATQRVNSAVHALGATGSMVQSVFTTGPLSGMSKAYSCGLPHNMGKPKPAGVKNLKVPGLGALDKGLLSLSSHLDWGLREITKWQKKLNDKMKALLKRKLGSEQDKMDLLCTIREVTALTQMAATAYTMVTGKSSTTLNNVASTVSNTAAGVTSGVLSTSTLQPSTPLPATIASPAAQPTTTNTVPSAMPTQVASVLTTGGASLPTP